MRKLDTSYRVITVLRLLNEKPMDIDELCWALDSDGHSLNRETISKYFATLRHCGCVIEKRGGKFWLKHIPFFINLQDDELETLAVFEKFSRKLCFGDTYLKIQSAIGKILKMESPARSEKYRKMLDGIEIKNIYSGYREKMECISKFFGSSARILYKETRYKVSPKRFKYSKNQVYLYAYDKDAKSNKLFLLDDIKEVENSPLGLSSEFYCSKTVFKIKGRLHKAYRLYEDETIFQEGTDFKVVVNKSQDKKMLMSRLLKYGECCEIIEPKTERQEFAQMLDKMIAAYS